MIEPIYQMRKPDLTEMCSLGIPKDFRNVMMLFNDLLAKGKLPHIPRKSPISVEEIQKLWMPSVERNITYLGLRGNFVVASGTLLIDENSNRYSAETGRGREYSLIFHPVHVDLGIKVTGEVLKEAKKRNEPFVLHISAYDEDQRMIMNSLGYKPTKEIPNYERYAKAGLDPRVLEYIITPDKIRNH